MTIKERQLKDHFNQFIDRDAKYPGYVLTDEAWKAFKKSESYGKKSLSPEETLLAEPLFGAKWSYEITIQSLWQEMAEYWSQNMGWFLPLRHTIVTEYWGPSYGRAHGDRVYLRALLKIRDSIRANGFIDSLMAYTGLDMETKQRYLKTWMANNPVRV